MKKVVLFFCLTIPLSGCFFLDTLDRARQLRTYANMQAIVGRVEEIRATAGEISDKQIAEILLSKANGRDETGGWM
jgi:hypothetical protein